MKKTIKFLINFFSNFYKKNLNYYKIKKRIKICRKHNKPINLIIGAGNTEQINWIPTEKMNLDILKNDDFNKFFFENEITKVLSEHVFEHLTLNEGIIAIKNIKKYLLIGGRIRIAVPDGFFPKQEYIDYVKPGGFGSGAEDHKELYNFKTIIKLFDSDFKIDFLEYFDEDGNFQYKKWDIDDGKILRSRYFDSRNSNNQINYSSLILDAIYIG